MSIRTAKALTTILALAGLFVLASAAPAATYLVRPNGSGDYATIQDAVDGVVDTDIIELADGTFEGTGNRDIDFLGKAITIRSQSGDPTMCTIDCGGDEFDPHRGFWFHSGEGSFSVLENIRVVNGYIVDGNGGAVLCEGAAPTIEGCIFGANIVDGTGVRGGAIHMVDPPYFVMTGCRFTGNTAGEFTGGMGGAVAVFGAEQGEFHDCTFGPGNFADMGGGVFMDLSADSDLYFQDCIVTDNGASSGAGIFCDEGVVALDGCSVYWNQAATMPGTGGGLYVSGSANIVRSTFMGNMAVTGGNMYFTAGGGGDVNKCVVVYSLMGGGIHAAAPTRDVNVQCCDVAENTGGNYTGTLTDQTGINDNISEDPLFCDAPSGDLTLYNTSPCAPANSPCEELIGSSDVDCYTAVEESSWGRIKSSFE